MSTTQRTSRPTQGGFVSIEMIIVLIIIAIGASAAAAGMFSSSNANEEQRNISVIAANARALKTSSGYGSSGTNLIPSLIAINGVPKNMSVSSGVVYNVYGGSVTVSSTGMGSRSPPASCPRTPVSRWPPRSRRTPSSRPRSTADPRSLVK